MMLRGRAPTEIVCTLKDLSLSRVKIAEKYLRTFQHFTQIDWQSGYLKGGLIDAARLLLASEYFVLCVVCCM